MKRFTISCDFEKRKWPFHLYVGEPAPDKHPLQNQAQWLSRERNGSIPIEVWESFRTLHEIAREHKVPFAELCVYAQSAQSTGHSGKTMDEDEFAGLRSNLQKLEKSRESVHQLSDVATKRSPGTRFAESQTTLPADSLLRGTLPETCNFVFETSKILWPGENELSLISRLLFLGTALYVAVVPDKVLALTELYRFIRSEDLPYSLSVALDTSGKTLPSLGYTLISQWLNRERWLRDKTVFHMTATLTDFAMGNKGKSGLPEAMRKELYQSLFDTVPK